MKSLIVLIAFTAACTSMPEPSWKPAERPLGYDACEVISQDGSTQWIDWRTFDDAGFLVSMDEGHLADNGASILDRTYAYTYRRDRVETVTAKDVVGTWGMRDRYTYDDEHGQLVLFERDAGDGAPDGTPNYREFDTRTADGRLTRIDYDDNADGTGDRYALFTTDAYGCTVGEDYFSSTVRDRITLENNPACKVIEADHDIGADGTIDNVETWTYGPDNVSPHEWHDNTGSSYWYYDGQGRLMQFVGSAAHRETYHYDCQIPRP